MNNRLYAQSFINTENLGLVPIDHASRKNDKPQVESSLAKLEKVLKDQEIKKRELFAAPKSSQTPNEKQRRLEHLYLREDDQMNNYKNSLGDYSMIAKQMDDDRDNAIRSMNVSTLQSAKEVTKLANQNLNYMALASEFGLIAASDRMYKKSKKTNKLSAQINYL